MLKTVSTIVLVLGLAATGCSKKKDAPAGDKPATTEAAKPAEGAKPTEAPKTEEAKPAEAPKADETKAAPAAAGAVTFATDDEYIAACKELHDIIMENPVRPAFRWAGTTGMLPVVNEAVVAAVAGTKDPQAATDEAAAKLTEILKNGGYIK